LAIDSRHKRGLWIPLPWFLIQDGNPDRDTERDNPCLMISLTSLHPVGPAPEYKLCRSAICEIMVACLKTWTISLVQRYWTPEPRLASSSCNSRSLILVFPTVRVHVIMRTERRSASPPLLGTKDGSFRYPNQNLPWRLDAGPILTG
jgi:hypothetical protein